MRWVVTRGGILSGAAGGTVSATVVPELQARRAAPGQQTLWLAQHSLLWLVRHALLRLARQTLLPELEVQMLQGRSEDERKIVALVGWSVSPGRVGAAVFAGP